MTGGLDENLYTMQTPGRTGCGQHVYTMGVNLVTGKSQKHAGEQACLQDGHGAYQAS